MSPTFFLGHNLPQENQLGQYWLQAGLEAAKHLEFIPSPLLSSRSRLVDLLRLASTMTWAIPSPPSAQSYYWRLGPPI